MRQRWRKGQEDRREEGEEERKQQQCKTKQGQSVSLLTLSSFIPVFKVHTRSIRAAGTIRVIPLFLPT